MSAEPAIGGLSLMVLGLLIFLQRGYFDPYSHHYVDHTEAHRYIGATIMVVGAWFLGKARG